ncbi:MAG: VOC family protein [Acidobacteriales bacterium]|nr:VOC family protein [Terriglobales bacterium]
MLTNRSMPECTVIPVLSYPDVNQAIDWLCKAFGFSLRLRIGDHRAQLAINDGAIVITKEHASSARAAGSVMVRVEDVHRHSVVAIGHGARLISPPADYPYGERQYTVEDIAGHRWTFSQTLSDTDPEEWGGSAAKR